MNKKLILLSILFFSPLLSQELPFPDIPFPYGETTEDADFAVVVDEEGTRIAVWIEKGVVKVSESPLKENWSIPTSLSNPFAKASSPKIEIDSNTGKARVLWLENDHLRVSYRTFEKQWVPFQLKPSFVEENSADPWKDFDLIQRSPKKRLAIALISPELEKEEDAYQSDHLMPGLPKHSFPKKGAAIDLPIVMESTKRDQSNQKVRDPLSNAIDAPTGGGLSGGQIGFAAGTAAPSNGLIVSGSSGFGTSSPATGTGLAVSYSLSGSSGNLFNLDMRPSLTASSGTVTNAFGMYLAPSFTKTGNITVSSGIYIDTATSSGGGTIGTHYGIRVSSGSVAATNSYGVYVAAPTGSTNNFTAYFDPGVGIGGGFSGAAGTALGIGAALSGSSGNLFAIQVASSSSYTASSGTISNAASLYMNPSFVATGAITNAYGIYLDSSSSSGAGGITNYYGIRLGAPAITSTNSFSLHVTAPTNATNKYTAYFDVGVGIGVATPFTTGNGAAFRVSSTSSYNTWLSGTQTADDGANTIGLLVVPTYTPANSSRTAYNIYAAPVFSSVAAQTMTAVNTYIHNTFVGNAGTVSDAYGILINGGGGSVGTITNHYGLYCKVPVAGTNKYTAYFDVGVGVGIVNASTLSGNGAAFRVSSISAHNTYLQGTQTGDDTSSTICLVIGAGLAPSTTNRSTYGIYNAPTHIAAVGNTIPAAHGMFVNNVFTSNAGTISFAYGILINGGGAAVGTISNHYGLYCGAPVAGTNKYTARFDSGVGIGADNPTSSTADFLLASTKAYSFTLNGTVSATVSDINAFIINQQSTLTPTNGASQAVAGYYNGTSFVAPTGKTITRATCFYTTPTSNSNVGTISNLVGFYYDGGSSGAGTITNSYGIHIEAVAAGTTRYGLYIAAPTGGTNNWGARIGGKIGLGADGVAGVGINASLSLSAASGNLVGLRAVYELDATAANTVSNAYNVYSSSNFTTNAGTVSNGMSIFVDSGAAGGTITNGYGIYVSAISWASNRYGLNVVGPTGGSANYTAYFDGGVGIGTLADFASSKIALRVAATTTSASTNIYQFRVEGSLGATGGNTVAEANEAWIYPDFGSNAGTITSAYGINVSTGGTAGTITTGYGIRVQAIAYGTTRYGLFVDTPTGGTTNRSALFTGTSSNLLIDSGGNMFPVSNKVVTLGKAGNSFSQLYAGVVTTGTSRLGKSKRGCATCGQTMMRGTGTFTILGEIADYLSCWCCNDSCTNKGLMFMEEIKHLPVLRLAERRPPPKIEFLGFVVFPNSGNSRYIRVDFRYVDKTPGTCDVEGAGLHNSTFLTDVEYAEFVSLTSDEQREYLYQLGLREWNSMEELRLMKEECNAIQLELNSMTGKWINTDLMKR